MAAEAAKLHNLLKDAVKGGKDVKSLLNKNLTDKVLDELKDKKTTFNGTLADCIRSGKCLNRVTL